MKNKIMTFLAWSAVLALPVLGAQEAPLSLTSDQAVALALEKNLGLQLEDLKVEVKNREKDYALNRFIPSLTTSATLSRQNTQTTVSALVPFPSAAPGIGAPVSIPGVGTVYDGVLSLSRDVDPVNLSTSLQAQLPLSLALFTGIRQTVLDYESAVISREGAREKLSRDVRKAFYSLLALQESLGLTERQVESARQRYLQTQASFRSGLTPQLSMLQAQVAWENRKPSLEDQRLTFRQTLLGFKNLLGIPLEQEVVLQGSIQVPQLDLSSREEDLVFRFLDRRLDLAALKAQGTSLENLIRLQQEALWPALVLMASVDPSLNAPFEGTSWESADNWKQRSGMISLTLSWKLDSWIPGSTAWVGIENLKTQARQLEVTRQQALRGAAMEVKIILARLKKSAQSLETLNLSVNLARKAYELSEAAYKAGSQSLLEVRDAELQLQGAQLQVLNEKLNFNNGLLDLEGALGTPWTSIFEEKK